MTGPARDAINGEAAIAFILNAYPSLTPEEALTFLFICAEDGLSLKALSKRLGEGQSTVARFVATLEQTEADGTGVVVLSESRDGELRRTVHMSAAGRALTSQVAKLLDSST